MHFVALARLACDPSEHPDSVVEIGTYTSYNAVDVELARGKFMALWTRTVDGTGYKQLFHSYSPSETEVRGAVGGDV